MSGNSERDRYRHGEARSLSDAILETIERVRGEDVARSDFRLYDDVNPDALDELFREDADADTTVQFDTDDVTVTLWGDGDVDIQVRPQDADPPAPGERD